MGKRPGKSHKKFIFLPILKGLLVEVVMNKEAYRRDWIVEPESLIRTALMWKLIDHKEANSRVVREAAQAEAESLRDSWPEGEGFGSSDRGASVRNMLRDAGLNVDYVGGMLTRIAKEVVMNKVAVAAELIRVAKDIMAMDFSTEEGLREYLRQHPSANPAAHHVKPKNMPGETERQKFYDVHHASQKKAQWESLPSGWTKESLRSFYDSLAGGGDAKKKFYNCVEKVKGTDITNPESFCGSLLDQFLDSSWRGVGR